MRFWGYGAGLLSDEATAGGIGPGQGRASTGFRRLACPGIAPMEGTSLSHERTIRLMAASLTKCPGSDVNEEGLDFGRDGDGVEAAAEGRVMASRGGICRVLGTRNVPRVYNPIVLL